MKKILLLILCITSLSQTGQVFCMEVDIDAMDWNPYSTAINTDIMDLDLVDTKSSQAFGMKKLADWDGLPLEIKTYLLKQYITSLITNREFKLLNKVQNQKFVDTKFQVIIDDLFTRNNNNTINKIVNRINKSEDNPISKLALAKILLDKAQFNKFIENNNIDLIEADQLGQQLVDNIINCNTEDDTENVSIEALIKQGANINIKDVSGRTALVWVGFLEISRLYRY